MQITSIHRATIQYVHTEDVSPHAMSDITDELDTQLKIICRRFPYVYENTDFRSQAWGFEIESEDMEQLKEAAKEFDKVLLRYLGLIEVIE